MNTPPDSIDKKLDKLRSLILWHLHQDVHNTDLIMEAIKSTFKEMVEKAEPEEKDQLYRGILYGEERVNAIKDYKVNLLKELED